MPQQNTRRNEIVAGTFVLAMVAVAAAGLITVSKSDSWFASKRTVEVAFSIESGVRGISLGSPVQLGGLTVGSVAEIRRDLKGVAGDPSPVIVLVLRLPGDVVLRRDADVTVSSGALGGGGSVNIRSLGKGAEPAAGEFIVGTPTAGSLAEDTIAGAGIGNVQKQQLRDIIGSLAMISADVRKQLAPGGDAAEVIASFRKMAGPEGDLNAAIAGVRKFTDSLKPHGDEIVDQVKLTLARLDRAVDKLQSVAVKVDREIDPVLAKLRKVAEDVEAVVAENRADIRTAVKTAKGAIESAEAGITATFADAKEIAKTVRGSLASVDRTLASLEKIGKDARDVVVLNKESVDDALRSFKEAGTQLKLATREIRRAPWRLLYKPDEQERDSLNLLDAARLFNDGAGKVEDTIKRLSALAAVAEGKLDPADPQLRRTIEELRARLKDLEKAEKALFDGIK
jgi:ABC-type transporter Mla subunit MlaD